MNYYKRYMALESKEKAIEQARQDMAVMALSGALLFNPEIVNEIKKALDKAFVDMEGEAG